MHMIRRQIFHWTLLKSRIFHDFGPNLKKRSRMLTVHPTNAVDVSNERKCQGEIFFPTRPADWLTVKNHYLPKYRPLRLILAAYRPRMGVPIWIWTLKLVTWLPFPNPALWLVDSQRSLSPKIYYMDQFYGPYSNWDAHSRPISQVSVSRAYILGDDFWL